MERKHKVTPTTSVFKRHEVTYCKLFSVYTVSYQSQDAGNSNAKEITEKPLPKMLYFSSAVYPNWSKEMHTFNRMEGPN